MRTCFEGWLIPSRHAVHQGVATASDRVAGVVTQFSAQLTGLCRFLVMSIMTDCNRKTLPQRDPSQHVPKPLHTLLFENGETNLIHAFSVPCKP